MLRSRPKQITETIRFDDGREIHPPDLYKINTLKMARRQGNLCAICKKEFTAFRVPTFDHQAGRGSGGGHRDDRIMVIVEGVGEWLNAALCVICQGVKGSRRYEWVAGLYVPVVR